MSVRSALPWPFRWVVLALVFGFCAAVALWAFEFGREIAGLDGGAKDELVKVRAEVVKIKDERDKAQLIANTAGTLLTAEKAEQAGLIAQNRQMEADNRALREDLSFFEKLIPSSGVGGIAIRGLQAEVIGGRQLKWQVMVMQTQKNAPEFSGRLELSFTGLVNGKPWTATLPEGNQAMKVKQYGRMGGVVDLPPLAVVKTVSVKVMDGAVAKATQTVKL
jgi:hypothetical protein